jgi:glucose/arabinose dehydrogenase
MARSTFMSLTPTAPTGRAPARHPVLPGTPGPIARALARALHRIARIGAAVLLAGATVPATAQQAPLTVRTERANLEIVEFAGGLVHPWGLTFLPDGQMLVTERPGRLRRVARDGQLSPPIAGVPPVHARGQGGLLDVAISPDFATDRTLFLSYAEPTPLGGRTAVARAVLEGDTLRDLRVIFRQVPDASGGNHWGGRLVFGRDGNLFVTLGDRFTLREQAQDLGSHLGKVVRIRPDGSVPPDNPFVARAGALPEIWSYGHRNVQGAALHPSTGQLWTHEHGPQGGDEVNLTLAGRNYGWPKITFGREYGTGFRIGEGTAQPGIEAPLLHWTPSIAPSGMAFYPHRRIPGWEGSLLVGALAHRSLYRLQLEGERIVAQERLFEKEPGRRIRDVRVDSEGRIYLLTDEPQGAILRIDAK